MLLASYGGAFGIIRRAFAIIRGGSSIIRGAFRGAFAITPGAFTIIRGAFTIYIRGAFAIIRSGSSIIRGAFNIIRDAFIEQIISIFFPRLKYDIKILNVPYDLIMFLDLKMLCHLYLYTCTALQGSA